MKYQGPGAADGNDPDKKADASEGLYVVQVGAFAMPPGAWFASKWSAGLKLTPGRRDQDAPRIRVRRAFATRAERTGGRKIKNLSSCRH